MKILTGVHNSRRLGRSLGVNLFKSKTCSLDCIYCECGPAALYTSEDPYTYKEIIKAIDDALIIYDSFDYLAFSGLGEPTLHPDFVKIIAYLKSSYSVKVCVITNTTTISEDNIQKALHKVDVIMPSIDAISQDVFNRINKPRYAVSLKKMLSSFKEFSHNYSGELFLEVFFSPGVNDSSLELSRLIDYLKTIKYTRLDINSLDRAPSVDHLEKMTVLRLQFIKELFVQNGLDNINIL